MQDPTIEDTFLKRLTVDDEPAVLEILDTARREEGTVFRDGCARASICIGLGLLTARRDSLS